MLLRRSNVRETNSTLVPRTSRNVIEKTCRPPPCTGVRASPRFSDLLLFSDIYLYLGCTRFPYLSRIFNSHLSATFLLIRLEKVSLSRNPSVEIVFFFPFLSLSFPFFFYLRTYFFEKSLAFLLLPLARVFSPLTRRVIFLSQERKKERRERKRESETIGYSRGYSNDASLRREKKAEKTRRRVFKHGRVWNVLERRRDF